jgi:hypothetical protein
MSDFPLHFWKQVQYVVNLLRSPAAWVPTIAGFAALIVSLLIVPKTEPSIWNWLGLPLIAILSTLALLAMASRTLPRTKPKSPFNLALIAIVALAIATILNLFLTLTGTATLLIGICLIAAMTVRNRRSAAPSIPLTGVVALLVPIWVWISLDQGNAGLLLLIPLGLIAWYSDRQMQAALAADTRESASSARSWRFISWLGILTGATLTSLLAISSDVNNGWAVVGALGAIACIAADAGLPQHASLPGRYSRPLIGLGFAWLILCWLVSL